MKEWICEEVPAVTLDGVVISTMLHQIQELVRCKDCKYVECEGVEGFLVCDLSGFSHSPEFFCADGERKEDR